MELIAAIIAPILTGTISFSIYLNKKNNEVVTSGFNRLYGAVTTIERKVDDLRVDVAKNYVPNEVLAQHIEGEEHWHVRFGEEMAQMRDEVTSCRVIVDRMWMDFQNSKGV